MASDDSKLVNDVVDRLKKQGLFDKFRKECMADVDTKVIFELNCDSYCLSAAIGVQNMK